AESTPWKFHICASATAMSPSLPDVCFSSRRRHTRSKRDWSSDVCSSDLSMRDGRPNPDIWGNIITCGEIAVGIYEIVGTKKRGQIGRASCREKESKSGEGETDKEEDTGRRRMNKRNRASGTSKVPRPQGR